MTKADYGHDWPFTIDEGTVRCNFDALNKRPYITFDNGDGIEYALNGAAADFGFPALDESILIDYPDKSGVQPFIDLGLTLC